MRPRECAHESDVLSAIYTRRWPDRADKVLRAHVETCATCQDLVEVVSAFEAETDAAVGAPSPVPDASRVWIGAQLRARQDAARTAVRPITVAQAVAFAATIGAVGAIFGATATWFQQGLKTIGGTLRSAGEAVASLMPASAPAADPSGHWVLASVMAVALLASLALYYTFREE